MKKEYIDTRHIGDMTARQVADLMDEVFGGNIRVRDLTEYSQRYGVNPTEVLRELCSGRYSTENK